MYRQLSRWLLLAVGYTLTAAAAGPWVADPHFGINGLVTDPMFVFSPGDLPLTSGRHVAVDEDGSTVVAALSKSTATPYQTPFLVIARYDRHGQRVAWSNPTAMYVDPSGEYLYLRPAFPGINLFIAAVRDMQIDGFGNIQVLVDAQNGPNAGSIDTFIVTFGADGAFKSVVTHQASLDDDVGAAIVPWGSDMFVISTENSTVHVARYHLNTNNGIPDLDTDWGNVGRVTQTLVMCKRLVGGVLIPVACNLRARHAEIVGTDLYIGGEYDTDGAETDLFVIGFSLIYAQAGTSVPGYPFVWGFGGIDDNLRGMVHRSGFFAPAHPQNEWYLLDAFSRPCRYGFVVARANADTATYIDRTWTQGGGTNTDPNVCAATSSLQANGLALARDFSKANRYLAVVGGHTSGEPYTGTNAFLALVDTQNLQASVPVLDFTDNAGQYPSDTTLMHVQGNVEDGSYTATGVQFDFDGDSSRAVILRTLPDRIFSHGFEAD